MTSAKTSVVLDARGQGFTAVGWRELLGLTSSSYSLQTSMTRFDQDVEVERRPEPRCRVCLYGAVLWSRFFAGRLASAVIFV